MDWDIRENSGMGEELSKREGVGNRKGQSLCSQRAGGLEVCS